MTLCEPEATTTLAYITPWRVTTEKLPEAPIHVYSRDHSCVPIGLEIKRLRLSGRSAP